MGIRVHATVSKFPTLDGGTRLLEGLTRLIEFDTRPYVKVDTRQTMDSAASSDFSSGVIVYSAHDKRGRQYAGYAYSDPNVAKTDRNAHATSRWYEAASADRLSEWVKYVAQAIVDGDAE